MMKKQRRRMISLMLAVLLALSSFTPYVVYAAGGVTAGSNDNVAGGQQKAADYNMHGWGMMVTLYSMENDYKDKEEERDEIERKYLEEHDTTSTVINIQTSDKYLKDFPDFWLKSGTASKSALIFHASNDKYNEWTSGKKPTNKFIKRIDNNMVLGYALYE